MGCRGRGVAVNANDQRREVTRQVEGEGQGKRLGLLHFVRCLNQSIERGEEGAGDGQARSAKRYDSGYGHDGDDQCVLPRRAWPDW